MREGATDKEGGRCREGWDCARLLVGASARVLLLVVLLLLLLLRECHLLSLMLSLGLSMRLRLLLSGHGLDRQQSGDAKQERQAERITRSSDFAFMTTGKRNRAEHKKGVPVAAGTAPDRSQPQDGERCPADEGSTAQGNGMKWEISEVDQTRRENARER